MFQEISTPSNIRKQFSYNRNKHMGFSTSTGKKRLEKSTQNIAKIKKEFNIKTCKGLLCDSKERNIIE